MDIQEKKVAILEELKAEGGEFEGRDSISNEELLEFFIAREWRLLELSRLNGIRRRILGQRTIEGDDKATLREVEAKIKELGGLHYVEPAPEWSLANERRENSLQLSVDLLNTLTEMLKEQVKVLKVKEPSLFVDPEGKLKPAEMIILENGRQLALRRAAYGEEQRLEKAETKGESK
jgi:hypothetical protein